MLSACLHHEIHEHNLYSSPVPAVLNYCHQRNISFFVLLPPQTKKKDLPPHKDPTSHLTGKQAQNSLSQRPILHIFKEACLSSSVMQHSVLTLLDLWASFLGVNPISFTRI